MASYAILTFDCYGTLIDWEVGITGAFAEAAHEDGLTVDPRQILEIHSEVEPAVQAGPYRPYREVLEEVARETARRLNWPLAPDRARFLPESLPGWEPFPDTNPALERLKAAGYRLGILSNIDDDLLAGTLRRFTVEFDLLVTAEQVRSYKPAHAHFIRARELAGSAGWLHVAQSCFHDIEPACTLGIPVVWVNRKHEPPSGSARPTAQVTTLDGLVEWLMAGT